jgi:endoglucanase
MVWLNGQRFNIKGVSWFGFETYDYVVHGLWAVDYKFIIDFLAANNFNAVRLPFSLDMVLNNPNTNTISYWCNNNHNCNSDLNGVKALGVLDKIISYMGTKGIAVLLDMHSFGPGQASSNGYWYDGTHSEATVIQGWNTLATRYKNYWNVFGMDIKNEPFSCTWGSGNLNTDFNLAAQRIGNAITANSNWLVFVEGITCQSGCFKGENLQGVQHNPVVLNVPNRVVYSPHAYGPDVFPMTYFYDAAFPNNMAPIWNSHFGYIKNLTNTDSALVVGEWGGTTTNSLDLTWLNTFSNYLKTNGLTDNFFWAVNPNSGQTGGILQNDWITP